MKRPSPLIQMTMALVALCSTLVLLGSLFLDTMPDRRSQQMQVRKAVGEALAVQVAEMLQREDAAAIQKSMSAIVARTEGLRSVGVRRVDGTLVLQSGPHAQAWQADNGERSRPEQVSVPLNAEGKRWGRFEAAFAAEEGNAIVNFLREPLVQMLIFVGLAGWLVFGLYMRRALQHLDPSSVVPERVQGAFDAMAEGVVVLDARARVMLANKAFRALHPELAQVRTGGTLSALPWLAESLDADVTQHPWSRAMADRVPNAGTTIDAGPADDRRQLVLNAAPISDPGGAVRGCMVTLNDMSALHRANAALREAMAALEASKQEVESKNAELERLATRDPLTGVLNRRAFQAAVEAKLEHARRHGTPLSCLMVDIDHFKKINDTHGHGVGDRVIQEVARKLQQVARATDLVCRWGGEEFCVIVDGLEARDAAEMGERMRARIERECGAGVREATDLQVTASVGVEQWSNRIGGMVPWVERADQALYRAKRGGRNRVVSLTPLSPLVAPPPEHVDPASGCLQADGFGPALRALRELARAEDRVAGCILLAVDPASAGATATLSAALAAMLREAAPADALVARLDDRRLAIALVGRGIQDCAALAEQLRQRLQQGLIEAGGGAAVGVSAGVDALAATAPGSAMLAERAEQALQRGRRQGGNRVSLFASPRDDRAGSAGAATQEPKA